MLKPLGFQLIQKARRLSKFCFSTVNLHTYTAAAPASPLTQLVKATKVGQRKLDPSFKADQFQRFNRSTRIW